MSQEQPDYFNMMNPDSDSDEEIGVATQKISREIARQRLKELNKRAKALLDTQLEVETEEEDNGKPHG